MCDFITKHKLNPLSQERGFCLLTHKNSGHRSFIGGLAMQNMTISLFDASSLESAPLEQIAELYCSVWREPPWNEDFWIKEEVINDIKTGMQKMNAALAVAFVGMDVVGFAWGYEVSPAELKNIVGSDSLEYLFQEGARVGYIAELAVGASWRSNGIGHRLNTCLVDALCECGTTRITLRTDEQAQPARRLYDSLRFKELGVRDAKFPSRTYWLWTNQ